MDFEEKREIKVRVSQDEQETHYSNVVIVSFSSEEFIFDFTRLLPGVREPKLLSRIIMTPRNAKAFYYILKKNIKEYEKRFGTIILEPPPDLEE